MVFHEQRFMAVAVMKGVEIIRAVTTSDETMAIGKQYLQRWGKRL